MRNKHMVFQDPIMQGSYYVCRYIGCKGNTAEGWMVGRTDK